MHPLDQLLGNNRQLQQQQRKKKRVLVLCCCHVGCLQYSDITRLEVIETFLLMLPWSFNFCFLLFICFLGLCCVFFFCFLVFLCSSPACSSLHTCPASASLAQPCFQCSSQPISSFPAPLFLHTIPPTFSSDFVF